MKRIPPNILNTSIFFMVFSTLFFYSTSSPHTPKRILPDAFASTPFKNILGGGQANPISFKNPRIFSKNTTGRLDFPLTASLMPDAPSNIVLDDETCGESAVPIHRVQGEGLTSPLNGERITIEGVVVGDFQNNSLPDHGELNGFYLQEEPWDIDGDPRTSEGIFIDAPEAIDVRVGDVVRLTGRVLEAESSTGVSSRTQISDLTRLENCGEAPLPPPEDVRLPVFSKADFERYEGMRVRLSQNLIIAEAYRYPYTGEIVLAQPQQGYDRLFQPTQLVEPGTHANALQHKNNLRRIILDDGQPQVPPYPAIHPNGRPFDLKNRFRSSDRIKKVLGIMDHSYGGYRIHPTQRPIYTAVNPRPSQPKAVGGSLKVASFNLFYYCTTLRHHGARTPAEFQRQQTKIVQAVSGLNADIVGLNEIENNSGKTMERLVHGLNQKLGPDTYNDIRTGTIGGDDIKVALIYKPATVTPIGPYKILDAGVNPEFIDQYNRPVLIQTFEENLTGQRLTVAVNHLISKGSRCIDINDTDKSDGQGNCNQTRAKAAKVLVEYLAADPTHSADPDFLIIGDLNAYSMEDPIKIIERAHYTNLVKQFSTAPNYTFVYNGQFGTLDYALANPSLAKQVTGATVWHINTDEPNILSYALRSQQDFFEETPFRSSDHDPLVVGLNLSGNK